MLGSDFFSKFSSKQLNILIVIEKITIKIYKIDDYGESQQKKRERLKII